MLITENRESQCPEGEEDLEILQQSHEDPTGPSEEPETWSDMDQDVDQCEAAEEKGELVVVTEPDEEGVGDSRGALEERGLEDNTCDPQTPESPEPFDESQMTAGPMPETEPLSAAAEPPQHLKQLAETVNLAAAPARPEDADLPDQRAADERVREEAEQQTEPPEQKEQTSRPSQAAVPEQLEQPRETDEPEITEQLPAQSGATQEAAEEEFSQDKRSATSHQVEGVREGGSADAVLANEEQAKPSETAAPHANGREVDSAMARRLAERLFELDGFQRVDVVKHLDKEYVEFTQHSFRMSLWLLRRRRNVASKARTSLYPADREFCFLLVMTSVGLSGRNT